MRSLLFACSLIVVLPAGSGRAQTPTLPYDHMHFGVPDPARAVEWWGKHLGGLPGPAGEPADRLMFGSVRFAFLKTEAPQPSAGSAVDHIGLSFPDLDAKMKEFEQAGIKIVTPLRDVPGLFKLAFIEDPWGTKIEVVQDAETLGFHHVHLRAPDPPAVLKWYLDTFGGEQAKLKGRLDAVRYGTLWLLAQQGEATPTSGHAIDHLGWRTPNLDALAGELKARGVKFTSEPRALRDLRIAFVESPAAVKIELVQR